jgi:TPR repeat protein/serine/threonine protein kinase
VERQTLDLIRRTLELYEGSTATCSKKLVDVTCRLATFLNSGGAFKDAAARAQVANAFQSVIAIARVKFAPEVQGFDTPSGDHTRKASRTNTKGRLSSMEKASIFSCSREIDTYLSVAAFFRQQGDDAQLLNWTQNKQPQRQAPETSSQLATDGFSGVTAARRHEKELEEVVTRRSARTSLDGLLNFRRDKGCRPSSYANTHVAACSPLDPWRVNPLADPLIPLREPTLRHNLDGASVPCMWRGQRVVAKVVRGGGDCFQREADFLWAFNSCENTSRMLGGFHDDDYQILVGPGPSRGGKNRNRAVDSGKVGYIIFEVSNGASLYQVVKCGRLIDMADQVQVLSCIVSTLLFCAGLTPPVTHQELHPSNIRLVPKPAPPQRSSTSRPSDATNPAESRQPDMWTTRADGTLRISSHTIKILDFGSALEARSGTRVASTVITHSSHVRRYLSPEKLARRRQLINDATIAAQSETTLFETSSPLVPSGITKSAEVSSGVVEAKDLSCTSLTSSFSSSTDKDATSKDDVWSVGWLLYFMTTGRHPPDFDAMFSYSDQDALSSQIKTDMKNVRRELQQIVLRSTVYEAEKRATLRDVKQMIDEVFDGILFAKGLALLKESMLNEGIALLDMAVGLKASRDSDFQDRRNTAQRAVDVDIVSGIASQELERSDRSANMKVAAGLNLETRTGLSLLPHFVVRRVEWERAAREHHCTDAELAIIRRTLSNHAWSKADVRHGQAAIDYLAFCDQRTKGLNASAKSAAAWIYRWGVGNVPVDVPRAMQLWSAAVEMGEAEAANGLGLIYHHGRPGIDVDWHAAQSYYELAVGWGCASAAVNLGVLHHNGEANFPADGVAAERFYSIGSALGDPIAANNIGVLYQCGCTGVEPDVAKAVQGYTLAISRGERNHAHRNLGDLFWNGAGAVPKNRTAAIHHWIVAMREGDSSSQMVAALKLKVGLEEMDRQNIEREASARARARHALNVFGM